jgi:hypothetical protein
MTDQQSPPEKSVGPPPVAVTKEDWILQQLNLHGREIGQNTAKLETMDSQLTGLSDDIKLLNKTLQRVLWTIAFASGALVVLGFLINLKAEEILNAFSKLS